MDTARLYLANLLSPGVEELLTWEILKPSYAADAQNFLVRSSQLRILVSKWEITGTIC